MKVADKNFIDEVFSSVGNMMIAYDALTSGDDPSLQSKMTSAVNQIVKDEDEACDDEFTRNLHKIASYIGLAAYARHRAEILMSYAFDAGENDGRSVYPDMRKLRENTQPLMRKVSMDAILQKRSMEQQEREDAAEDLSMGNPSLTANDMSADDPPALMPEDYDAIARVFVDKALRDKIADLVYAQDGKMDIDYAMAQIADVDGEMMFNDMQRLAFMIRLKSMSESMIEDLLVKFFEERNLESTLDEADDILGMSDAGL